MKKIFALLLAVLLIAGVFCGCGGNGGASPTVNTEDDGANVNLIWAIGTSKQKDTDLVLEEVNKLLAEKLPNTTLELKLDSSFSSKWALWMAGQTQIDIGHSGYHTDLATEINKNSYLALDELIEQYAPTIKAEREKYDSQYATGELNGKLYAIPCVQIHINDEVFFSIPEELYQYFDAAAFQKAANENPTTTQVFYDIINQYLDKVTTLSLDTEKYAGLIGNVEHIFRNFVKRGYEFVGGNNSVVCYKLGQDTVKIENFYETEECKLFLKNAADWYAKGLISKDILTGEDGLGNKKAYFEANITNFRICDINKDEIITPEELKATNSAAQDLYYVSMTPENQKYIGSAILGSLKTYLSIPITSKNPARAMKLLELLRTEEGADILNMLVYGIEGKHYEVNGENSIKAFEYGGQASSNNSYGFPNWMMGNMMNMYTCYPYNENTYNAAVSYFESELPKFNRTPIAGMGFDNEPIENNLAQISAADTEFKLQLIGGVATTKYMDTHATLMSKFNAAGLDKVIAEYQKQADAYAAANK